MLRRAGMARARSATCATVSGSMFLARFVRTLVRLGSATGLLSTSSDSTAPAMTLGSNLERLGPGAWFRRVERVPPLPDVPLGQFLHRHRSQRRNDVIGQQLSQVSASAALVNVTGATWRCRSGPA